MAKKISLREAKESNIRYTGLSEEEQRKRLGYAPAAGDGGEPQEQAGWRPDRQTAAGMMMTARQAATAATKGRAAFTDWMEGRMERLKKPLSEGRTIEGGVRYNPQTRKLEETHIDAYGGRTFNKLEADEASRRWRQDHPSVDMTVGGQMRRAQDRLQELKEKRLARAQELADENRKTFEGASGLFAGLGRAKAYEAANNYDQTLRALDAAIRQTEEQLKTLGEQQDRENGKDVGFWRGFSRVVTDPTTWDFGMTDLRDAATMLHAADPARPQTEQEKQANQDMLRATYENQQTEAMYGDNASFWNRAGMMIGHMPSFMLDFAFTDGGFEAINMAGKASTKLATKVLGKEAIEQMAELGFKNYVTRNGLRGLGNEAANWTIKALGTTADELLIRAPLMTNTVQGADTAADIIDRKLGDVTIDENGNYNFTNDKTWGSAIWQGEANSIVENYSEMFGAHLPEVASVKNLGRLANVIGAKRLSGVLAKADAGALGGITDGTRRIFQQMGVSDYLGEVSEEYYGQLWRTMLNLDDAYRQNPDGTRTNLFATGQFHGDIWGGMALSMGLMGAGKTTMSAANYLSMKHDVNKADARASELLTPEVWEPLRSTIDMATNDNVGDVAEVIVNDRDMTDEEKTAVLNYMERSLYLRGVNLAELVKSRGGEQDENAQRANDSYMDGYNAVSQEEMQDASNMYMMKRGDLAALFGLESASETEDFVGDPLAFAERLLAEGDSRLGAVLDYVNARMVYEGMMQRVRDDIDSRVASAEALVDSRVNRTTGMIEGATLKVQTEDGNDRRVYVVGGKLSAYEDGTGIDKEKSDSSIIIRDAETGKVEMVSPDAILSIEEPVDPETEKQTASEVIRQQMAQEAANRIDGAVPFNEGDTYRLTYPDGRQEELTVVENGGSTDAGEGRVWVTRDGGFSAFPMSREEIQTGVDATNRGRAERFDEQRQAQMETETDYGPGDVLTLRGKDGETFLGEVVDPDYNDGTVLVQVETPAGPRVMPYTREELWRMRVMPANEGNIGRGNIPQNGNIEPQNIPPLKDNFQKEGGISTENVATVSQEAVNNATVDDLMKTDGGYVEGYYNEHPEKVAEALVVPAQATADYINGKLTDRDYLIALGYANGNGSWLGTYASDEDIAREAAGNREKYLPYVSMPQAQQMSNIGAQNIPASADPLQAGVVWRSLSEEEAEALVSEMEAAAGRAPEKELTPAAWRVEFGDDGTVETPLGRVKLGENQISKLFSKGREKSFGMIRPTLETPQIIIEEPSSSADGEEERGSSYLFVRAFTLKNGEKVYFFKSVTIKKDGLEVSVSNHLDRAKRIKESLKRGKLLYRNIGGAQTEQLRPTVSGTTSPTDNAGVSLGKVTENAGAVQTGGPVIPRDAKGRLLYEQADPDMAWDAIVEQAGGNEAMAQRVADSMVSDKEAELKKAEKAKPKGGTTVEEKLAAERERENAVERAKANLAAWQRIAQTSQRRKQAALAEQSRQAEEAARLRREQEEQERAERKEAERIRREALNGVPDIIDDTPQDARARGYRRVNGEKVDRQAPLAARQGKEVLVKFDDKNIPTGHVALIEVGQLQPSHINGRRNPFHFIDEAQPKERNDEASVMSARRIAANIRPEEITSSVTAYTGAPTVNTRGEVIQGNNRSAALREMWAGQPGQATGYKQYLADHASDFGLAPEDVEAMQQPVLVNMVDVSDEEAISLGQFVAQDTESGGTERIKPKNIVQKMSGEMRTFASRLLSSPDEEMTFSELVDRNGMDVLRWMQQKTYITPTQYRSAFDSKGNLTAEAKNDLKGIMYQSIFQGGSTHLEEMFNTLPAKAQKSILATAYRDYDSPNTERLNTELQNSISAYYALSQTSDFANAKNYKEARMAAEAWKSQLAFDDVTGESYLPSEKYSNFALLLATMYKGQTQTFIQNTLKNIFDLVQGTQEATLFEEPDNTPRTLSEAINETLNSLSEELLLNGNFIYNGQRRDNVLAGSGTTGQPRRQGSTGSSQAGGRDEGGTGIASDNRGTESSVGRSRTEEKDRGNQSHGSKADSLGRTRNRDLDEFFGPVYTQFQGKPKEAEDYLRSTCEGVAKGALTYPGIEPIDLAWGDKKAGYMKIVVKHPEVVGKLQDILDTTQITSQSENRIVFESGTHKIIVSKMKGATPTDNWLLTAYEKKKSVSASSSDIETEPEGKRNGTATPQNGPIKGETSAKTEPQQPKNAVSTGSSLSENEEGGITSSEPNGKPTISDSKDMEKSRIDSGLGEKIAQAEAETDQNPTEAQKEAGNYKKGHVRIGQFNITVENPKGSVRRGTDADGKAWETTMQNTYGYIRGTEGVDGDHIDVFLSDDPTQGDVYVIDQVNPDTGEFDEHKVMYGFKSALAAKRAYLANYLPGWQGLGTITKVSKEEFKKWIDSSHRKTKPFAEYKSVRVKGAQNEADDEVIFREAEDNGNKSLVGVHNITEDKLDKAIRQGGLANPSVAVIDADRQTHEGYGEISLIMPSSKIDRRTGRNAGTFTNDAWTPMYPQIERQFGKGGNGRASKDIGSVPKEMQSEVRQGINSWMDGRSGIGLEYLFLYERGEAPETVRVEAAYPESLRNEVAGVMDGKESFTDLNDTERQAVVDILVRERYDGDMAKYTDEIADRIRHDEERIAKRPNSLFSRRVKMDVDFMKEHGYDYSEASAFVDAMVEDNRTAGTADTKATLSAAQSSITERGLQEEYDKWLDGLNDRYSVKEVIFDGFTPSGNRRYVPNTLENVSRLMKKSGRNGATGITTSFSNFAASVLKAKGSLKDIREKKVNLTSDHKDVEDFREKWNNVFYELGMKLQPDATGFDDYGLARLAEAATQKNPKKYIKDEYGIEMSDADAKKLDDMVRAIREDYPAMYFETKFERPVYFSEFTAAVVPNTIKQSTRKALEDAGLKLFEYDPNTEGNRRRAFNEATREDGVRFRRAESDIASVNDRFNEQLDGLTEENADSVMLSLGRPSAVLRAAGVEDKPMKLYGNKVMKKMRKHGFTLAELHDLPQAVANPIAVFNNYQKDGNRSILTELRTSNGNFLVTIDLGKDADADFNIITSVFGKGDKNVIDWINKGYATYVDKKKTLDYLHFSGRSIPEASNNREGKEAHTLLSHQSAPIAATAASAELVSAANIVRNFENPSTSEENLHTAHQHKVNAVQELAEKLHLDNVDIVTDASALQGRRAKAKGFYSRSTGRITIVIPNHASVYDVEQTLLHEAVAHYGLRQLFGEHFDTFLDNVFQNADEDVRRRIVELAGRRGWDFRTATEEYLASLAENTNFDNTDASWWQKIKELFLRMLHKIGFEDFTGVTLSDNELRYILWRSYENLAEPGRYRSILGEAEDVAKQYELKVGNYAPVAEADGMVAELHEEDTPKKDRLRKLRESRPVEITGEEIEASENLRQYKKNALEYGKKLQGSYVNKDTGITIQLQRGRKNGGVNEVLQHDYKDKEHLQSIAAIPQIIENSIYIDSRENTDKEKNPSIKEYQYYVCGLRIGGVDYTVRSTIAMDHKGNRYYDHKLTSIEKGRLLDLLSGKNPGFSQEVLNVGFGTTPGTKPTTNNGVKDKRLLSILQADGEEKDMLFREGTDNGDGSSPLSGGVIQAWDKIASSTKFQLTETAFDYLNAVDKFQKLVSSHSGKAVEDFENAYDALTFLSSKNREEMDMFDSFLVKPLNDAIIGLTGKAGKRKDWKWDRGPLRSLVMYVEAKHGTGRNRQMAVEAVAKADGEDADAIMRDWNEAKKRINSQEDLSWAERQAQLAEAATELGADISQDYSGLSSVFRDKKKYPEGWQRGAVDYVTEYEETHGQDKIQALWKAINNATGFALQKQYETGLVSREYVERQKERFENYIPLRGFEDDTAGDVYNYLGHDYYPGSNPVKSARGRTSEPGNPFGSILNTAYASISSGNKNVAKTAFYALVVNHDTGGLAVANRAWKVRYADLKGNPELENIVVTPRLTGEEEVPEWVEAVPRIPEKGTAEEIGKALSEFESVMNRYKEEGATEPIWKKSKTAYRTLYDERNEHEIPLYVAGDKYVVTITGNPRVAQAVNGLLNPDSGGESKLSEYAMKVQRFMAGTFTAKNAAFSIANLIKDTTYANNQAFIRENPRYWLLFTRNQRAGFADFPLMMRRLYRYRKGELDMNDRTEKMFAEFMKNGGATGYTFVNTQEAYAKELEKRLRELSKGRPAWFTPAGSVKLLFDCIEFAGQAAELVNRFAAYKTGREMGRSINRSIRDAKEITVNFNRKGAGRKTAGENNSALVNVAAAVSQYGRTSILFWNTNMQSKYRFFKNLREHPVKTGVTLIANSMALSAILIPLLNNMVLPALYSAFGGGDGDDENADYFNALTDYERTHNICIRLPEQYWLKVPLSPEMVPWFSIGDAIGGQSAEKREMEASDIVHSTIDAVSPLPVNWSYEGWQRALNFLPTVGQPVAQNMMNVNFMGSPIKKTPLSARQGKKPEYTMVYRSASPTLVELSRFSNRIFGGEDDKTSGGSDWNPSMIQNLISGYTGGYGTTFLSVADWIVGTSKGEKQAVTFSRMPFVSRFAISGNKDVRIGRINSRFYDVKDFVTDFEYDMDRYAKRVEAGKKGHDPMMVADGITEYHRLLDSERARKYNELVGITKSVDACEKYLKEFPDDEATQNLLYQMKSRGIEILRGDEQDE